MSPDEAEYIDRQQGLLCARCKSNLRSMVLAEAIMRSSRPGRTLRRWVLAHPLTRLLEVNDAGLLGKFLRFLPRRVVTRFPEVDMQALPFADQSFDLVVHSDTLEHVPDPILGLSECRRVLKRGGVLCYTVPVVVGRMTRRRPDDAASYHGVAAEPVHLVHTEYGADFWTQPIEAGFDDIRVVPLDYPAGLALMASRR